MKKNYRVLNYRVTYKILLLIVTIFCFSIKVNAQVCTLTGSGGNNVVGVVTTGGTTNINLSGAAAGTDNYASIAQTLTLAPGNTFNLSVTQGDQWSRVLIWIDFNGDNDYGDGTTADTGEFFEIGNSNAGNTPVLATDITVPTTAVVGTHTMRILSGDAWAYATGSDIYDNIVPGPCASYGSMAVKDFNIEITNPTNTFTGSGSDWSSPGNWSLTRIPLVSDNVDIPASKNVTISSTTGAVANDITIDTSSSLTIEGGGSLIVDGTSSGSITYNVNVSDTSWHLVSSPVVGEQYNDTWIANNDIASGLDYPAENRGVSTYDNTSSTVPAIAGASGHWRYFQVGGAIQTFGTGTGYGLIKDTNSGVSNGNFSFTGTIPTVVAPAISQNANNWNLIGNSYPSYMNVAAFITANTATLDANFKNIYVWNPAGAGSYDIKTGGYIQPGQAFFVNSNGASTTASITKAMQSHQTGVPFSKSATPSISLHLSNGASTKKTKINYLDGKTASLDPGFDIGMFDGVGSDLTVYTHLINNNEGIAFARQALPNSDFESMVVPLGVKAAAGKEITFSAEALNLPTGIKVFLEDRSNNTSTRLDEANSELKITLTEAVNGVGRFYLHTKQNSVLNVNDTLLSGVSIYKTNASTISIAGLPQGKATISLFNSQGKQILTTSFEAKGVKDIFLPSLATGIYFANLQTETGKMTKKIILE